MALRLRYVLETLTIVAVLIALHPFIEFVVMPPDGAETRWLVTIGALFIALISRFYARELRVREKDPVES